jgi:hypothetical protein
MGPERQRTCEEFVQFASASGPSPTTTVRIPDHRLGVLRCLPPVDDQVSAFGHVSRRLVTWHTVLGPMVLTVGIAADPDHRFWKLEFCDHTEGMWLLMEVLWQGLANQMCNLEVSVIAVVQSLPGLLPVHCRATLRTQHGPGACLKLGFLSPKQLFPMWGGR